MLGMSYFSLQVEVGQFLHTHTVKNTRKRLKMQVFSEPIEPPTGKIDPTNFSFRLQVFNEK